MRIPFADPLETTRLQRVQKKLIEPVALTGLGRWYLMSVAPRLDRTIGIRSGGRIMSVPGVPLLLLTHRGAKSGRTYTTALVYFSDGADGDVVVIASNYGQARHPAWLANVRAHPEVRLQARGRGGRYRAHVAEGAERDRLFGLAKQLTRAYADYERRTADERTIQLVVLSPLDPA